MSIFSKYFIILSVTLYSVSSLKAQTLSTETIITSEVWVDTSLNNSSNEQSIVVWFDKQLLGNGNSFLKRIQEFKGEKRSHLRQSAISTLKSISNESFDLIKSKLSNLEQDGHIHDVKQYWIINGFSCTVNSNALEAIKNMDGVVKIFRKPLPFSNTNQNIGPEYIKPTPNSSFAIDKVKSYPWNIEKIQAQKVWKEYSVTGKGTLNAVHDFGFKLDASPIAESIYVNIGEIPGNEIDDDENGFVDDYHGYNFDADNASLNNPTIRGTLIHGNACVAMISGTFANNTQHAIGIAPESKWTPIIGSTNIESAVEWAIEQGVDTYSMSFSQPNLGEYRSHWRKIMEQATFCGIIFISGAGNFAATRGYAPVPVQMRNPEDIPDAVLGVSGVGQDGIRPVFSSQGPVKWNTDQYNDGQVSKPDFATLNFQIPCIDLEGNLSNVASGNSFAGPHMAGIVSLMFSANPELLPWEIKEILIKTAKDIGDPGFDYQSGYGFVNAYDAVTEALKWKK